MHKVSIIIPVIRPQNIKNLVRLIKENAGVPEDSYEVLIEEDKDRIGAPKMVKKLTDRSQHDLVMFIGDDCQPQPNFLRNALEAMDSLPDRWGLIGLNDMQRPKDDAPTHWLAHKNMLKYCKEFFHTGYIHQYCDNELHGWALLLGRYERADNAKVYHDHVGYKDKSKRFVINIEESNDADMKRVYSPEAKEHDLLLFRQRKKLAVETITKITMEEKINNIKASHRPGSSMINSQLYHDLPFNGMECFPAHRSSTQARIDQILDLIRGNVIDTSLDIGCSVGGLSIGLSMKGIKAEGIDYDEQSIAVAEEAAQKLGQNIKFKVGETNLEWAKKLDDYDLIIWMSQWMWLIKQYGMEEAKQILFEVSKKGRMMVFESSANDGMAAIKGATQDDIERWLYENTIYKNIERHPTVGGWANRDVFFCHNPSKMQIALTSTVERISPKLVKKTFYPEYAWQAEREVKAFNRLSKYKHYPKVHDYGKDYIIMDYVGEDIKDLSKFPDQVDNIRKELKAERIRHRDLIARNFLILDKKLYLIDFGWCIFDDETDTPIPAPDTLYGIATGDND